MNSPYEGEITIDAKLLHALWCYGNLHTVEGVICQPGSHQECLAIVDRMFRDRAQDSDACAPSSNMPIVQTDVMLSTLRAIADFPITDPKNLDAMNMQILAHSILPDQSSDEPACRDSSEASQHHSGDLEPGSSEAIAAIEAWRANPATTFTPANILRTYGDAIVAALVSRSAASTVEPVALATTLEHWAEALRTPTIAEHSVADLAMFNGRCITEDLEDAAKALRAAPTTSPEPDNRVYVCYDGFGDHYVSRDPKQHTAICYDEDFAEEIVSMCERRASPEPQRKLTPDENALITQATLNSSKLAYGISPEPDAVREALADKIAKCSQIAPNRHTVILERSERDLIVAALSAPVAGAWQDISTAPEDDRDILVGAWGAANGEDPEPHEKWFQQISSREDRPYRRGYRHRNGACWATHWHTSPAVTVPRNDRGRAS